MQTFHHQIDVDLNKLQQGRFDGTALVGPKIGLICWAFILGRDASSLRGIYHIRKDAKSIEHGCPSVTLVSKRMRHEPNHLQPPLITTLMTALRALRCIILSHLLKENPNSSGSIRNSTCPLPPCVANRSTSLTGRHSIRPIRVAFPRQCA